MWIIILLLLIAFILWNTSLIGYRDKQTQRLQTDESKVFCEMARSITYKQGSNTAILLVHGFPSTPAMYTYSAKRFHDAGFDVYSPLMPGFGTDPKDLEQTTFTQWFDFICRYYEDLRSKYETLFVLGTSMGGLMTLKLGEHYCKSDKKPDKLVTIAAPVVYNSFREGIFTDKRQYIARTLALFKPSINVRIITENSKGEDGSDQWYGYGGTFIRPGLSLVHAMPSVRKNLGSITCPLFSIHDVNDRVIPFKNLKIIEREQKSPNFRSLVTTMGDFNHGRHSLLSYHSIQASLTDTILDFLQNKENSDAQT